MKEFFAEREIHKARFAVTNTRFASFPPNVELDALQRNVEAMDYRERRLWLGKHRVPRFLYKFRPLVPTVEQSVDHMRAIVVQSELWLSSPGDFNDPFDMSAKYIADGNLEQRQARVRQLLRRQQNLTWMERRRRTPKLVATNNSELATRAQAAHYHQVKEFGVFSFAGDPRSILMWSHYGANHEGLCIQFEVARDFGTFGRAVAVDYSDEYPVVNWVTGFEERLLPTILRKHIRWKYEFERRIAIPGNARRYLLFRPEALRAIIVGCRAKEPVVAKLHELLAERSSLRLPHPVIYSASKHDSRYRLIFRRSPTERGG